jgi:hypothetical protein
MPITWDMKTLNNKQTTTTQVQHERHRKITNTAHCTHSFYLSMDSKEKVS